MGSQREAVEASMERVAERVSGELDALVEKWLDRMWQDPDFADFARSELREVARRNARADIGRELGALLDGCRLPVSCPPEVAASARLAATTGFPLAGVMQSYRTGHAVQWEAWNRAVEDLGFDGEERRALLDRGSQFMFEYADRCSKWAEQVYTAERERLLRGREQLRARTIHGLLAGSDPDVGGFDYDLEAEHLAAIAWGEEPGAAFEALSQDLEAALLEVAGDEGGRWAWLGSASFAADRLEAIRRFEPSRGTFVAIGGPAAGRRGFRRAHDEAQQARRVALRLPRPVTLHDDVGLIALATRDEERARAYVEKEVGLLLGADERSVVLRRTLRVYLTNAQQASSAAAELGVHERTVANRIHAVEERLGRSVAARHSELDVALRLEELLGEAPTGGTA